MKKALNTLLIAMAILLALVACSLQNVVTDELVSATLITTDKTRSLVAEVDFDISEVAKWMYTAEKADNGLETGATTTEVELKDGKTDLLSQGSWNFNLYGKDSSNKLICSGSIENATVTTTKHDVKITVKPSQTAEGKGSIVISDDIKIVSSSGAEYDKGTGDDEYTKVIEVYKGNETISFYDSSDKSKNADSLLTNVDSGLYRVLVSYRGTAKDGETTYTAAAATKVINVYDNLSTTVGGTVTETKQSASVTKSGATVTASATSGTITFKETEGKKVNSAEVPVTVNSSASGITASSTTSAETEQQTAVTDKTKTTISFPESSLTMDSNTTQVSVTLQSTTIESVASSYQIEASEGAAVAGFDFTLKGASSTFNSGVTVTTYITPGLGTYSDSNKTLKIKYIGDNSGTEPSIVSYDNTSGQLVFTVYHFSKYCIISTERGIVYDSDNNATYKYEKKTGEEEYKLYDKDGNNVTEPGNNLVLLDCALSNKVTDALAEKNWTVVHNNCDAESDGFWHGKNNSFADGYGTKLEPYMVADKEQFQNITSMYDKYAYYKVTDSCSDLDLSGWCSVKLHGSFDGSNKEFKNVTSYLFQRVGYQLQNENITLKNFSATFNVSNKSQYSAGAVVKQIDNSGTTTFDSVDVHGTIEGYWNVGSYYSYGTANYDDKGSDYTATFVNCKSDVTLICVSSSTIGGFVGHGYEGTEHKQTLNIDNKSEYTGTIYCAYDNSGNHYMGMNSTGTLIFNGKETSRYDDSFTKYEKRVKISVVAPQLGENGYTVQVDNNTTKMVVSVTAQLDAYQEDNTTTKSNMNGITMVLDSSQVDLSASSNVILRKVISAIIDNTASEYGYSVDDSGKMTVKVPGNSNYRSGTVRLTATQYKSDGTIICTGTVDVITITNPV